MIVDEVITPSSCFVQGRWDWTSGYSFRSYFQNVGRYTNRIQVYRIPNLAIIPQDEVYNYGHQVLTTRSKLRGSGRSLNLLFSAESGKDCHIYGWVLNMNVNSKL